MYSSSLAGSMIEMQQQLRQNLRSFMITTMIKIPPQKKEKIKILTDNLGVSLPRAWKRTYQVTATSLKYETE